MKTKKTMISKIIAMAIFFGFPFLSFGQFVKETKQFSFENERVDVFQLTSFECKYLEGKVYTMFKVLEPSDECVYVLERSSDGKTYDVIHLKKSTKSPKNLELLDSFVDKAPLTGKSYYRISRYTNGVCVVYSTVVENNYSNGQVVNNSTTKSNLELADIKK